MDEGTVAASFSVFRGPRNAVLGKKYPALALVSLDRGHLRKSPREFHICSVSASFPRPTHGSSSRPLVSARKKVNAREITAPAKFILLIKFTLGVLFR